MQPKSHSCMERTPAGYEGYNSVVYEVNAYILKSIEPLVCCSVAPFKCSHACAQIIQLYIITSLYVLPLEVR
jgi:hypothetical protein